MVPGATEPLTRPMMLRALGHTVRHILICKGEGGAWQAPEDMPAPSPSPALPAPQGAEPRMLLLRVDMMKGRQISHPGECQAHWHYHLQRNPGTIPPDHRPSHPAALFPLPRPAAPPWTPFLPLPHLLSILLTQWEPPTKSETHLKATLQSRQPHWQQGVGGTNPRSSSSSSYARWTAHGHLLSLGLGGKWSIHTRACQGGSGMGFEPFEWSCVHHETGVCDKGLFLFFSRIDGQQLRMCGQLGNRQRGDNFTLKCTGQGVGWVAETGRRRLLSGPQNIKAGRPRRMSRRVFLR